MNLFGWGRQTQLHLTSHSKDRTLGKTKGAAPPLTVLLSNHSAGGFGDGTL